MKSKLIICLLLILTLMTIFTTTSFAWSNSFYRPYPSYIDVHGDDTEDWCIDKKFSNTEAGIIAFHCENVDILYKHYYQWHLDRSNFTGDEEDTRILQSRNEMIIAKRKIDEVANLTDKYNNTWSRWSRIKLKYKIKKAKQEALMYLGRSIHPMQDLHAHMDAGVDTPDELIGNSHGMLDAPPVEVKVIYQNDEYEIRKMKLDTMSGDFNYSMYDDVNYDYVDGQWMFKEDMSKEKNTRWKKTMEATYDLLEEFIGYAKKKGVEKYLMGAY